MYFSPASLALALLSTSDEGMVAVGLIRAAKADAGIHVVVKPLTSNGSAVNSLLLKYTIINE